MAIFLLMDQLMTIASIFYSFYCLYAGNLDTSTWLLPFQFAVPFETKTVWKWYILWVYNLKANLAYAGIITSVSSYFVCCCLYIQGICNHFNLLIQSLQNDVEQYKKDTNPKIMQEKSQSIKKTFCKAIEAHVTALE